MRTYPQIHPLRLLFRLSLTIVGCVVGVCCLAWLYAGAAAFMFQSEQIGAKNLIIGLVCSLVTVLFVTVFHVRAETLRLEVPHNSLNSEKIQTALEERGYAMAENSRSIMVFRPSFYSFLFGGKVVVQRKDDVWEVKGPKVTVEWLQQRFRFQRHVSNYDEHRKRSSDRCTDRVLRSVELRFRLPIQHWHDFEAAVLARLSESDRVMCDLILRVQDRFGISENQIEYEIRTWLEKRGILVEIDKELPADPIAVNSNSKESIVV